MDIPHSDRLMTEEQAKEVTLMVTLTKLLVAAAFLLGGWQTYVTFTLNQHTAQIAEVKATAVQTAVETSARLQDYRNWREDVTKIMTRQTALIEGQQVQLMRMLDDKR